MEISTKLTQAKSMLESYLKAEQAILTGQEYSMNGLRLRRADLSEIRKGREYWQNEVDKLESGVGGMRVKRIIPRDI